MSFEPSSDDDCVKIDDFHNYFDNAAIKAYTRNIAGKSMTKPELMPEYNIFKNNEYSKFEEWMKSNDPNDVVMNPEFTYSSVRPYPVGIVKAILEQLLLENKKLCNESVVIIRNKIIGFHDIDGLLTSLDKHSESVFSGGKNRRTKMKMKMKYNRKKSKKSRKHYRKSTRKQHF